jgi:hypothetical protein
VLCDVELPLPCSRRCSVAFPGWERGKWTQRCDKIRIDTALLDVSTILLESMGKPYFECTKFRDHRKWRAELLVSKNSEIQKNKNKIKNYDLHVRISYNNKGTVNLLILT